MKNLVQFLTESVNKTHSKWEPEMSSIMDNVLDMAAEYCWDNADEDGLGEDGVKLMKKYNDELNNGYISKIPQKDLTGIAEIIDSFLDADTLLDGIGLDDVPEKELQRQVNIVRDIFGLKPMKY